MTLFRLGSVNSIGAFDMSRISKFLFWLVLIAAIVATGSWIIGGKQTEHSTSLLIHGDPETVFNHLVEPDKLKGWVDGLTEVEKIEPNKKTRGTIRVTTKPRTMNVEGTPTRFVDEVLRYAKNANLTIRTSNSGVAYTSFFALEPRDERTYLTYRVKTSHLGVRRILAPFRTDETQDRIDAEIRRLKEMIESELNWATSPYAAPETPKD